MDGFRSGRCGEGSGKRLESSAFRVARVNNYCEGTDRRHNRVIV